MIQWLATVDDLAATAATLMAEDLAAQAAAGWFSLALAGGTTPAPAYRRLAGIWRREPLPWERGLVMPGDERLVAADDPARNEAMIRASLLAGIAGIPFLPWPAAGAVGADEAARRAERQWRDAWHGELTPSGLPRLGLVLLGLGLDGHTASIFSGSPALAGDERWIMAVPAPTTSAPHVPRLTLTGAVIRAARRVVYLVAGEAKIRLAERILADPEAPWPAAKIRPPAACDWLMVRPPQPGGRP
jgi:6-phosphogluconolactonase